MDGDVYDVTKFAGVPRLEMPKTVGCSLSGRFGAFWDVFLCSWPLGFWSFRMGFKGRRSGSTSMEAGVCIGRVSTTNAGLHIEF